VSEHRRGARYIDFEELREPGVAIFVIIPEGAASRYKIPLATFVGQAVEHLRAGEVSDDTTPVMFVVDEAAHVPIVNLKEIPGVGRGRRFGVMLFYQNLSQGYDMYGEHGFNAILGSINTKTFLPGCDLVTARYASELVGQTTVWAHSYDDAPGTQYDKTRTTEAARPLVDPAEIRQLPMHRQAVTTVETMPPVKWAYPKSVKTGARSLPRTYGPPRVVTFTEAERASRNRRLCEASGGPAEQALSAPIQTISDAASGQGRAIGMAPAAPLEVVPTAHEAVKLAPAEDAAAEQNYYTLHAVSPPRALTAKGRETIKVALWAVPTGPRAQEAATHFRYVTPERIERWMGPALTTENVSAVKTIPSDQQLALLVMTRQPRAATSSPTSKSVLSIFGFRSADAEVYGLRGE
jgi:hypothetical protein